ncbi:acyl carrier protein [Bradyrhizobium sp. GM24.11]
MSVLLGEELVELIAAELRMAPEAIDLDRAIADIPSWDSMAWISIITAVENRTGKLFPVDRIDDVQNVGDILKMAQS